MRYDVLDILLFIIKLIFFVMVGKRGGGGGGERGNSHRVWAVIVVKVCS